MTLKNIVLFISCFAMSQLLGRAAPPVIQDKDPNEVDSAGVALPREAMATMAIDLTKRIGDAPHRIARGPGLFGATGGASVRVTSSKPQELILPIPQLVDGQVPMTFAVAVEPKEAAADLRLRKRANGDAVLYVRLVGIKQEVRISWAAVVFLGRANVTPETVSVEPHRAATACAQALDTEIDRIAKELRPESGSHAVFASNIQKYIRDMKRVARPKSLDALGMLASGENTICTANANLALALLRSKKIACRSLAVIPTISQRLEMHRVVEVLEEGSRFAFDPSMVHVEIPLEPWHEVIMARTSIDDENVSMKPRMAVTKGCPYGQEFEHLTPGLVLSGQDFFWTAAKPLAEFAPGEVALRRAAKAWRNFLATGTLSPSQRTGSAAASDKDFDAAFPSD